MTLTSKFKSNIGNFSRSVSGADLSENEVNMNIIHDNIANSLINE
jgi:hypothetical protein